MVAVSKKVKYSTYARVEVVEALRRFAMYKKMSASAVFEAMAHKCIPERFFVDLYDKQ